MRSGPVFGIKMAKTMILVVTGSGSIALVLSGLFCPLIVFKLCGRLPWARRGSPKGLQSLGMLLLLMLLLLMLRHGFKKRIEIGRCPEHVDGQ